MDVILFRDVNKRNCGYRPSTTAIVCEARAIERDHERQAERATGQPRDAWSDILKRTKLL